MWVTASWSRPATIPPCHSSGTPTPSDRCSRTLPRTWPLHSRRATFAPLAPLTTPQAAAVATGGAPARQLIATARIPTRIASGPAALRRRFVVAVHHLLRADLLADRGPLNVAGAQHTVMLPRNESALRHVSVTAHRYVVRVVSQLPPWVGTRRTAIVPLPSSLPSVESRCPRHGDGRESSRATTATCPSR